MTKRKIFVFGSNLHGIHGAGSAKHAYDNCGALWGVGNGFTGEAYAIPTKNEQVETMSLLRIEPYVKQFIQFAKLMPQMEFDVVEIGCGLAGYKPEQIAPLFVGCPDNVNLPERFAKIVQQTHTIY